MIIKTAIIKLCNKEYRVSGNENMTKKQAYNKFINLYCGSVVVPGFKSVSISFSTLET